MYPCEALRSIEIVTPKKSIRSLSPLFTSSPYLPFVLFLLLEHRAIEDFTPLKKVFSTAGMDSKTHFAVDRFVAYDCTNFLLEFSNLDKSKRKLEELRKMNKLDPLL